MDRREAASSLENKGEAFRYAAFLSYSSKDAAFARRLHVALERCRIPGSLGRFTLAGKPNRVYPVFRDREELPSGSLGEELRAALRASNALVVVCSRNARASRWVNAEISYFRTLGRENRVFAIIVDGEPEGIPDAELFPAALREGPDEVLAADARKSREGFRYAWLKVVAGLISVNAGALRDRDRRQRIGRALRAFCGTAIALAIIAAGTVLWDRSNSRDAFTARAVLLTERGERAAALPFALAGLGGNRPVAEAALDALGGRLPRIAFFDVALPGAEIRLSPDGRVVATRSGNYEFELWDTEAGTRRGPLHHATDFWFADDSQRVVLLTENYRIEIVDTNSGQSIGQPESILPARNGDSVFTSGRIVAATSGSDEVALWDAHTGRLIARLASPDVTPPLHLSPSGRRLASCDKSQKCIVWDVSNRQRIALIDSVHGDVVFTPDDERLAARTGVDAIALWSASSGAVIKRVSLRGQPFAPMFSADGTRLAVHSDGSRGQLLDGRSGALLADLGEVDSGSDAVRFSGDGRRLLVLGRESTGAVWDAKSGKRILQLDARDSVSVMHVSPDSSRLLIQSFDEKTSLWDGISGRKIADLGVEGRVESVTFPSVGGRFLLQAVPPATSLWADDGRRIVELGSPSRLDIHMSEDGRRLVGFAGDGTVEIYDSARSPIQGSGEALRKEICAASGAAIPAFRPEERAANDALASYLKGRPARVCDWHPLSDGTGWSQAIKYGRQRPDCGQSSAGVRWPVIDPGR